MTRVSPTLFSAVAFKSADSVRFSLCDATITTIRDFFYDVGRVSGMGIRHLDYVEIDTICKRKARDDGRGKKYRSYDASCIKFGLSGSRRSDEECSVHIIVYFTVW